MYNLLLIEDDETCFNTYYSSYKRRYSVFPSKYTQLSRLKTYDTLYIYIKNMILENEIDLISLDLNFNKIPFSEFNDSSVPSEDQVGLQIIKDLSQEKIFQMRAIPILVISNFNEPDINKFYNISPYIIEFINKEQIPKPSRIPNDFPLERWFENEEKFTTIEKHIQRYKLLTKLDFISNTDDKTLNYENIVQTKKDLIQVIKDKTVTPYFQKIFNNKEEFIKYEVLARITHEGKDNGIQSYLNIAKQFGYLSKITEQIIKKSFKIIADSEIEISINIVYEDLQKNNIENLVKLLQTNLDANNLSSHQITLEILEGAEHTEEINNSIIRLQEKGYKIAIDDFGVEHSNFIRFKHLIQNIKFLKIDGDFIKNIENCETSKLIIKTIVKMIKEYNINNPQQTIKTVAEFVKNKEIYTICKDLGIDYFQGYYFHEPEKLDKDTI